MVKKKRRNNKNKILRFHRNGLKTKNEKNELVTYPQRIKPGKEELIKNYLTTLGIQVLRCKIDSYHRLRLIVSPILSQEVFDNFIRDFTLMNFNLDQELGESVGQYYFKKD